MSATTSARGYDWTAARTVDLWRWYAEDLETAEVFAASSNTAATNDHLAMAAAKLEAIERKLEDVQQPPMGCAFGDPNCNCKIWMADPGLLFGTPDADRIYGSAYLARHPEMQEA